MSERFQWKAGAKLLVASAAAERDLRLALSGAPFRIGGGGALEAGTLHAGTLDAGTLEAGAGQFETLTSGSSGAPRRILRAMSSWLASFAVNGPLFGIGSGRRVAVLGSLEQSLALYGAVEALHLGADALVLGGFSAARQWAALGQQKVDLLWASPAQLRLLLSVGGQLPDLRQIIVGGSKLDAGLRAALAERTAAQVTEFYGAAEASFITLAQHGAPVGSVGRAYPGVEIDLRRGEVWVRSPYLFIRYAGMDQGAVHSADLGLARWDQGWLSVGEMGHMAESHLFLHGRAGRMVTVADHNVFPEQIEAQMMAMQGVAHAAVLPRSDGLRGVHLIAVCQGERACEGAILADLRAQMGPLRAPKAILWRADWPHLPSGKTDIALLQAEVDAWR